VWIAVLVLTLASAPQPLAVTRAEIAEQDTPSPFLPAWHFFQSSTALEAVGQLEQASRAIAAALRIEPDNREYKRIRARISRKLALAARLHGEEQVSLTVKMGAMEEQATLVWKFGDDAYSLARSFSQQLSLGVEWEHPIYHLIVSHEQSLRRAAYHTGAHASPPWHIPPEELASFSMHGQARVTRHYIDDTRRLLKHGEQDAGSERTSRGGGERGENVTWTRSEIEELVRDARAGAHKYYGVADSHLFRALSLVGAKWGRDTHTRKLVSGHLSGKKVAVISIGHAADKTSGAWYDVC
jgi:hypothetical protein